MKHLRIMTALFLWGSSVSAQCSIQESTNCTFETIGHRGYSHIYPSNSLLALEEAFKRGIKYCEVDVSLTADNIYVLFHDKRSIYRVTNGKGRVNELSLAELRQFDARKWKDASFEGAGIATLTEALQIAEKYDAQLYLDTKDYSIQAMKASLEQAKVQAHRFLPSINSIAAAEEFRVLLPNTPWVWYKGGLFPPELNDPNFYQQCINLGCVAFEIGASEVDTTIEWNTFKANVKAVGSKIWAFTVNDNNLATRMVNFGVDAVESDRPVAIKQFICTGANNQYPDDMTTGNWRFKTGLDNSVHTGSQVRPFIYDLQDSYSLVQFGSCDSFGIAPLSSNTDRVMYVNPNTTAEGLLVYTNFSVDNEGTEDFTYTILIDFLVPPSSLGKWIALYQTSIGNDNDAELFINPDRKIGVLGEYGDTIIGNKWYRAVIAYDGKNQFLNLYLNGTLVNNIETFSNRWAVFNSSPPGENQGFRLMCDDNAEVAPLYISAVQVRDYTMGPSEIEALGIATTDGFPVGNADIFSVSSPLLISDSTKIEYDQSTIELLFEPNANLNAIPLHITHSSGSILSINTQQAQNLTTPLFLIVQAQDGRTKVWQVCARKTTNVGIENTTKPTMYVYPNPTASLLYLPNTTKQWMIKDLIGRVVQTGRSDIANVESLPSGQYIIQLIDKNTLLSNRFTVQH